MTQQDQAEEGTGTTATRRGWRDRADRWRRGAVMTLSTLKRRWRLALGVAGGVVAVMLILGLWWSQEPGLRDITEIAEDRAGDHDPVSGLYTAVALEQTMDALLNKPGGYLRNSRLPPAVMLDNMPNWELGVVWHAREWAELLRRYMTRADLQATEDADLVIVEPQFFFDTNNWLLPSTDSEYRRGLSHLTQYIERLQAGNAEFHVRSEDLSLWLKRVEERLETQHEALMMSVAKRAYDPAPFLGLEPPDSSTPRLQVDDVLYQTRGYSWALMHSLQGVREDFRPVFADPEAAQAQFDLALLELSALQRPLWSPWVLNGSGQGLWANHSLVAAAHLGRARLALAELRAQLEG